MAPAAHWASWADALHMIDQKLPVVVANVAHKLTVEEELGGCLKNWETPLMGSSEGHNGTT